MFLSIIIPYHKGAHFLTDALESLYQSKIEQAYEVIVVDASLEEEKEQTAEVFSCYEEKLPLVVVRADRMPGNVSACRNQGMTMAKGTYLYFMDCDDYVMPSALNEMIKTAQETDADMVYGSIDESWFSYATYRKEKHVRYANSLDETLIKYDFTLLHKMFRREYVEELLLDEKQPVYAHIISMAKVLAKGGNFSPALTAIYVKRRRNDEIQYPSLSHSPLQDREALHERACQDALRETSGCPQVKAIILKQKQARRQSRRKKRKEQIKHFFTRPTFLYRMIDKMVFQRLPMRQNLVVFESFLGKNYSDSCKYLYLYLQKKEPDMKCVWVINDKKIKIEGNCKKVKYLSLRWFYYTARAKYYINNMRQPIWMKRRKGSVFLETWHGTPLKRLVFDMEEIHAATPTYKMDMYHQSRSWTYLLSDNPFSTEIFERCFLYPREQILETGYPRNDILAAKDLDRQAAEWKKELGIPQDKKVILYAPTWRDDEYYGPGEYKFALKLDLEKMKRRLGDEYVLLLRTHYFIADAIDTKGLEGFAYNVSRYNDIAQLYALSDICITDYSSVFFDFANLGRPILFYVYDFEKYRDNLRGFYIDMETELPGPLLFNEEELYHAIGHIDKVQEKYKEKYAAFQKRFCCYTDGRASERVWEILK